MGLTRQLAESYVPVTITVSYAGQDGTPKPFLMIVDWLKVGGDWKIASEIILPVPPATVIKGYLELALTVVNSRAAMVRLCWSGISFSGMIVTEAGITEKTVILRFIADLSARSAKL